MTNNYTYDSVFRMKDTWVPYLTQDDKNPCPCNTMIDSEYVRLLQSCTMRCNVTISEEKNRMFYLIYVILTINKHMNNDTVSHDMSPVIWNKLKSLLQTSFSWRTVL